MRWRLRVALVLVLLLATPGVAAWSQFHGGPDRNVRAVLPGGPLDVIRVLETGQAFTNSFWGSRTLATPHGLVLVKDTNEGCEILLVEVPYDDVDRVIPVTGCNFGLLVAYDEVQDAVLLCDNAGPGELALPWRSH